MEKWKIFDENLGLLYRFVLEGMRIKETIAVEVFWGEVSGNGDCWE